MAFFVAFEGVFDGVIEFFSQALVVTLDFLSRGPVFGRVGWQAAADGVNSKSKKLIERTMKGVQTESALRKEVPVKSFNVAQIKYDAVALGDGPIVKRLFANQLEELVGARAGF